MSVLAKFVANKPYEIFCLIASIIVVFLNWNYSVNYTKTLLKQYTTGFFKIIKFCYSLEQYENHEF